MNYKTLASVKADFEKQIKDRDSFSKLYWNLHPHVRNKDIEQALQEQYGLGPEQAKYIVATAKAEKGAEAYALLDYVKKLVNFWTNMPGKSE